LAYYTVDDNKKICKEEIFVHELTDFLFLLKATRINRNLVFCSPATNLPNQIFVTYLIFSGLASAMYMGTVELENPIPIPTTILQKNTH
jgi:hypothetical protein